MTELNKVENGQMNPVNTVEDVTPSSGEDMLLVQIDAFRDKAKQLQSLIAAKERKVKELEAMVRSKEERNMQLQLELAKKQEEADSIKASVEVQVDEMMTTLRQSVEQLEHRIEEQVSNNQANAAEQTATVKETLENMTSDLSSLKGDISEKVHSENVKQYRNIQDLMKEMDKTEANAEVTRQQFEKVKSKVSWVSILTGINIIGTASIIIMFLMMLGVIHF
ncbi:MAG: hypothetical protein IJ655_10275 [Lachnospiraceae bacterium]|nr:hypothetical protein [Lachnospiraceae bacterium]